MNTRHFRLGLLFCFSLLSLHAQVGELDDSFGNDGFVKIEFDNGDDVAPSLALQPDGRILQAGYVFNGQNYDFGLVRFLEDGTLDGTLGLGGKLSVDIGGESDYLQDMALQPDGKIIVCGHYQVDNQYDIVLARFTPSGELDMSFGENGLVKLALDTLKWESARALALQADGKIVITGYKVKADKSDQDIIVMRFLEDGSRDEDFGDNGLVIVPVGSGHEVGSAVALQPDGKILVAGETDIGVETYAFVLLRLLADGQLDDGFGNSGRVSLKLGNQSFGFALALQPDGKILVGGESDNSTADFALARFLTDGSPDPDFGEGGKVISPIGNSDDVLYGLALQPDGKILGAGFSGSGGSYSFALARYLSSGELDSSFGDGGVVTSALGPSINFGYDIILQPNSRILVGGNVSFDFAVARYLGDFDVGLLDLSAEEIPALIYPNPIPGEALLEFSLGREEVLTIELYDQQGRRIKTFMDNQRLNAGSYKERLLFSDDLPDGQYFVGLSSPKGKISIQVLLVR